MALAKLLAVPVGMTASSRPAPAAASAAGPTLPSPPATATRSAAPKSPAGSQGSPASATVAPCASSSRRTSEASVCPPEPGLASRAILTG